MAAADTYLLHPGQRLSTAVRVVHQVYSAQAARFFHLPDSAMVCLM